MSRQPEAPIPGSTSSAAWWRRVFEVLDQALDVQAEERGAFVRRACGGNPALAAEVARLLAHADAATVLDAPAAAFVSPLFRDLPLEGDDTAPGARIGSYRILPEIGHGGMGTVYLAEPAHGQ